LIRQAMLARLSSGLRHRHIPTTSQSVRSSRNSAKWEPTIPVMPVMRARRAAISACSTSAVAVYLVEAKAKGHPGRSAAKGGPEPAVALRVGGLYGPDHPKTTTGHDASCPRVPAKIDVDTAVQKPFHGSAFGRVHRQALSRKPDAHPDAHVHGPGIRPRRR